MASHLSIPSRMLLDYGATG